MTYHIRPKTSRRQLRRPAVNELVVLVSPTLQAFAHILSQYPMEACGFLGGKVIDNHAIAEQFHPVSNLLESADRFMLCTAEIGEVAVDCAKAGMEIIAFVHSHTNAPEPSSEDRTNMRFLPMPWMIVGGTEERVVSKLRTRAFQLVSDDIRDISVTLSHSQF